MNPHLVRIPSLAPLAAGALARSHLQVFGGEADGSLGAEVLGAGALDELGTDFFEGVDFAVAVQRMRGLV